MQEVSHFWGLLVCLFSPLIWWGFSPSLELVTKNIKSMRKRNLLRNWDASYFAGSLCVLALILCSLTVALIFLSNAGKLTEQFLSIMMMICGGYFVADTLIRNIGLRIFKHFLLTPNQVVKFRRFDATNQFVFHASVDVVNRAKHKRIVLPRKLHDVSKIKTT